MNNKYQIVIFIVMLCVSHTATAEKVYEKPNKEGVVEFSDQPSPGAKKIEVKPNVVEIVPAKRTASPPSPVIAPKKKKKTNPDKNDELEPDVIHNRGERLRKRLLIKEQHKPLQPIKGGAPGSGAIRGGGARRR